MNYLADNISSLKRHDAIPAKRIRALARRVKVVAKRADYRDNNPHKWTCESVKSIE